MSAITYFRLNSPYEGDITKNCALTGQEVDNNFFTLEGRDIKSVELNDDKIVVTLINGKKLTTENITKDCVKDLTFDFDEINGVLTITKNGITQTFTGFATNYNIGDAAAVDGTLIGNGLSKSPIGISPIAKTGQYRPVKAIINTMEGEKLPSRCNVITGDRYLTVEKVNDYGYLYNYEGLKKIACKLAETNSPWRIPTKQDWDDMLNAIEPCEEFRNHDNSKSNKFLGKFAGKFLKSKDYWKKEEHNTCDNCCNDSCNHDGTCIDYTDIPSCGEECSCGKNITCHPNYCGEYGTCHYKNKKCDNNGIDKYGFRIIPSGYATEAKDYLYFNERAYFWTASNHEYRDAYIKAFAYNKSNVLQDIFASDNYLSVRLVKNYSGDNFNEREEILGDNYSTILMPSVEHGKAIWTSVNISLADCGCDCCCKYLLPNNGEGMVYTKRYFTNEWNGKEWIRKELLDGESVVVINKVVEENNLHFHSSNDNNCCHDEESPDYEAIYKEYRLVNGELVDVSSIIYDGVMEAIEPRIGQIETKVDDLSEKLNNEIERSTQKDNELESSVDDLNNHIQQTDANIATVNVNLVNSINTINENVANGFNTINENVANAVTTINEAIEAEREIRGNKDTELEEKLNTEKQERETKDAELNERINGVANDLEDLNGKLLTQEGTAYNAESGILTLKSRDGSNDVEVKFAFNFGTF